MKLTKTVSTKSMCLLMEHKGYRLNYNPVENAFSWEYKGGEKELVELVTYIKENLANLILNAMENIRSRMSDIKYYLDELDFEYVANWDFDDDKSDLEFLLAVARGMIREGELDEDDLEDLLN